MISDRVGDVVCTPLSITSGIGLVSQVEKYGRTIAGGQYKNYIKLRTGDFAYNKSSTKSNPEGFIARYDGIDSAAVPNSIFTCFRINSEAADSRLLKYYFEANLHGKFLRQRLSVGARAHGSLNIADSDLLETPIPLPRSNSALAEQRKIAECLESLDALIAAETEKLEAMKRHKKGLLQQLFPLGETTPRLRFPEFRISGDWKRGALGPLTNKVGSGITPTGGSIVYVALGVPFVRSQNVGWGVLLLDDMAFINVETHSTFQATEIMKSDVLLNITGASIGRSAIADERVECGNVNQHVCIIRTDPSELSPEYLCQWLNSDVGQLQIDSFQAGGNRQGLNFQQVRSFQMPLPSIFEQRSVAEVLNSVDFSCNGLQLHVAYLRTHKAALMQQLFPSLDDLEPAAE